MKRKLLSILALLLFVSVPYAQSTITVYVANAADWSNTYIYYWTDYGDNDWPGTAMELIYTDDWEGLKYYRATIPDNAKGVVFTDGVQSSTKKTCNITSGIADGAWWQISGTSNDYDAYYRGLFWTGGNCGTSVTWSLNVLGEMTISGTGAMDNYSNENQPWEDSLSSIKSIVIENGVTSVGEDAFYACHSLASVNIPASVTSIGSTAFFDCKELENVTIVDGSKLTYIYDGAFSCCDILGSITIPASVTYIGSSAFSGCGRLENVTFGDGSLLKTINSYAFCEADITTITLPGNVTSIGESAFASCSKLGTITLNSNPIIASKAFPAGATVTMNLAANEGATDEYWTTYYNKNYNFQAADGTQIFKAALSDASLSLTKLNADNIITKNNAVILKSTASPISLTLTTTDSGNNFSGNSLLGVDFIFGITAGNPSTTYVLNKKNDVVGFYKLTAGKTAGVGKAYLTYSGTGASAREFFGFDESTRITTTDCTDYTDENGKWYTLDGRRIQGKPSKQGIYINNGKKVVIK